MSFLIVRSGVTSAVGKSLFLFPKTPASLKSRPPNSQWKFDSSPAKEFIGSGKWDLHGQVNSKSHFVSTKTLLNVSFNPQRRRFSTAKNTNEITMIAELSADNTQSYKFQLPMPNKERMLFSLKGDTTVKGFIHTLKEEDSTIQNATIYSGDGAKISANTSFADIVGKPFQIILNSQRYTISPALVAASEEANLAVNDEFEQMKKEIMPLYLEKRKMDKRASRAANLFVYGGLGYLVAQWAILARMTWWEFNWDIMEPVTYFITFGTAVIGYAYFALTKREYTYNDLREAFANRRMYNRYVSGKFDLERYYALEYKLRQKDPEVLELLDAEAEEIEKGPVQAESK